LFAETDELWPRQAQHLGHTVVATGGVVTVDDQRVAGDERGVTDSKKQAAEAISSGWPKRPSLCSLMISWRGVSMPTEPKMFDVIGVPNRTRGIFEVGLKMNGWSSAPEEPRLYVTPAVAGNLR
jgi:hypothetical protein